MMKDDAEFKTFFNEQLLNDLRAFNAYRKKILFKSFTGILILFLVAALFPLWVPLNSASNLWFILLIWISCIAVGYGAIRYITRDYQYNFKQLIIQPLIQFIDPNLHYSPEGSVDLYTFQRAEIFQRYVNEVDGEHLVSGTIDKTKICFSEITARYIDEGDEMDSETFPNNSYADAYRLLVRLLFTRNIFKGLFFVADFNKTFYGKILVLPDKAKKYLGRFGKLLQDHNFLQDQLIQMDHVEFEHQFVVYGSDQIQSRYVLTPVIMNKILDFKKKTNSTVWLSFKDSMLYMAVPYKKKLFEPKYFKNPVNYIDTLQYFQNLKLFIGIVEEFNLNTRIWTKE